MRLDPPTTMYKLLWTTPTAKRAPKIRYLALGFTVVMDHVAAKAKPKPTNFRSATRSLVATSVRSFSISAATCLCSSSASPRSVCAQVQRHCSSYVGRISFLWATTFEFAVAYNGTAHHCQPWLINSRSVVWRLLSEPSLPQQRRCCPSSASPRSGCAQIQRHSYLP